MIPQPKCTPATLFTTSPPAFPAPACPWDSLPGLQYGTVVFWGINPAEEQSIVHTVINPCKVGALELKEVEIDEFEFNYSVLEPPHIQVRGFSPDRSLLLAVGFRLQGRALLASFLA